MELPYIGITGFTTLDQVSILMDTWLTHKKETKALFMMGFLVSYKSFHHMQQNSEFCKKEETLLQMLKNCQDKSILRTIHYNTKCKQFFNEIDSFLAPILNSSDAIQLNIVDPDPKEITLLHEKYPNLKIILQICEPLLSDLYRLIEYEPCGCSYYLVDSSRGKGLPFNVPIMASQLSNIRRISSQIQLGLAGGILPESIHSYAKLWPEYSFDIQSGIRTNNKFSIPKAQQYLLNYLLSKEEK